MHQLKILKQFLPQFFIKTYKFITGSDRPFFIIQVIYKDQSRNNRINFSNQIHNVQFVFEAIQNPQLQINLLKLAIIP